MFSYNYPDLPSGKGISEWSGVIYLFPYVNLWKRLKKVVLSKGILKTVVNDTVVFNHEGKLL